jgi:N-acetylmuramoyl-L-alanine amidase
MLIVLLGLQLDEGPVLAAAQSGTGGRAVDPALFSAGSCISFPPTAGDRHEMVFLDAGHGGIDPGAVDRTETGHTIEEADETLPVELDASTLLRAQGFQVVVSRTGASSVARLSASDIVQGAMTEAAALHDVAARDVCANLAKAALLVGIYFDAGASPDNAGCLTAYDPDRAFSRANLVLATLIQHDVLRAMNAHGWAIPDVGVLPDAQLGAGVGPPTAAARYHHLLLLGPAMAGYFSTPSDMPGTVVEPLFITDPFEATIAASTSGQQTIAAGIATAVEQFVRSQRPS